MSLKRSAFWRYELRPRARIGGLANPTPRAGALLRLDWSDGVRGYADLFPWPELGDAPLMRHLEDLKQGQVSFLMARSMALARCEGEDRSQSRSSFRERQTLTRNHALLTDPAEISLTRLQALWKTGFRSIKIKMATLSPVEAQLLTEISEKTEFLFRLDFNAQRSFQEVSTFLLKLAAPVRTRIEFIEDPCPYDFSHWQSLAQLVPLALDHEVNQVDWSRFEEHGGTPFQVLIFKPARQSWEDLQEPIQRWNLKLVVTNSLDHSVGQMHAAAERARRGVSSTVAHLDDGLLIDDIYEAHPFSGYVHREGPFLIPPVGNGIGFDHELEALPWNPLELRV